MLRLGLEVELGPRLGTVEARNRAIGLLFWLGSFVHA